MKQHTPGPWRVKKDQGELQVWRHEPNESPITRIAAVCRQPFPIDHGDHVANARLIAAAPDLLAACRLMLDAVNDIHRTGDVVWVNAGTTAWELLTDVIAKATGTNPANIP